MISDTMTDSYLKVLGGVVSQGKTAPPPDTAVVLNLEPATRTHCFSHFILCSFLLFSEEDFMSSLSPHFSFLIFLSSHHHISLFVCPQNEGKRLDTEKVQCAQFSK